MQLMGIAALGPKPKTTKPAAGHKSAYICCANLVIDGPNQVWAANIIYIQIGHDFLYLVAIIDWTSRAVDLPLPNAMDVASVSMPSTRRWRAWQAGDFRHRPGLAVYQRRRGWVSTPSTPANGKSSSCTPRSAD